eukprot:NODE_2277_length_1242_cov_362.227158_g2073_i0.p1 GENE.NODE_2277_length_1242_cov_362.227158_g2073_i0~~NODE_2277_length_1242_cov_362.227158_g2073_i0.p1  ORF type:complete len:254 (+),score=64.34 NODE_2277_length_1242_cov_362.227158_g2073_i0:397-1158(+)
MAVGKNKRLSKGGKKGGQKRKQIDCMQRKEWYDVIAPTTFQQRQCCKTLVNKTQGVKLSADSLKGRVFEVSLGTLNDDETQSFRKIKLKVEEVQGRNCLTNFYAMSLTTDKLRSLIRKWCTLVESSVDVKTSDGYTLRVFAIGFTKRASNHVRKNCYAQTSQITLLRRKMKEIIIRTVSKNTLQSNIKKFQLELIGKDIERAATRIYPLRDVCVRKVKVVKTPRFDVSKLLEIHGQIPKSKEEVGIPVAAPED